MIHWDGMDCVITQTRDRDFKHSAKLFKLLVEL